MSTLRLSLPSPDRASSEEQLNNMSPDREDENNLVEEEPRAPSEPRSSGDEAAAEVSVSLPPMVPEPPQPAAPDPIRTTASSEVANLGGENDLDDEEPFSPVGPGSSDTPVLAALTVSLPPSASTEPASPLPPAEPSSKEVDENNLDDEDPLSPREQRGFGGTMPPQTVPVPEHLVSVEVTPELREAATETPRPTESVPANNLGADNDLSSGDGPAESGNHARETSSGQDSEERLVSHLPHEVGVVASENDLGDATPPTSAGGGAAVATDSNRDSESRDNEVAAAEAVQENNLNQEPSSAVVVTAGSGGAVAHGVETLNNLSDVNNLDDDEEVVETSAAPVQTVETTLQPPSSTSSVTAADEVNNLSDDRSGEARDIVRAGSSVESGVAVSTPSSEDNAENNLNQDSLTSSAATTARNTVQATSSTHSEAAVASGATVNNLNMEYIGATPQATATVNNLGVDEPSGHAAGNVLSREHLNHAEENGSTAAQPNTVSERPAETGEPVTGGIQMESGRNIVLNNLDSEEPDMDSGLESEQDPVSVSYVADGPAAETSNGSVVSVAPQTTVQETGSVASAPPGTPRVAEDENNLDDIEGQNNLDADEYGVASVNNSQPSSSTGSGDAHTASPFERSVSQPVEGNTMSQQDLGSASLTPGNSTSSLPAAGNTVYTPSSAHALVVPTSTNYPASAPATLQDLGENIQAPPTPQSMLLRQHNLTEDNKFDNEENNFSGDEDETQAKHLQGPPPASDSEAATIGSPSERRHVTWAASLVEDREDSTFHVPPHPTSAPVGRSLVPAHSSGAPFRASVDTSSYASTMPSAVASSGGEVSIMHKPKR